MRSDKIRIAVFFSALFFVLVGSASAQKEELHLEVQNGHSGGGVLAVAVSSDGKFALTGSTDQTALLWDLETGRQLRRFVGHEDAVSCVQFSKDGRFVLTASHDKTARLWETATGRQIRVFVENRNGVLIGHSGRILSCAISADMKLVATAGEDKTARIWDFETGKQLFELPHSTVINMIAISPDSKYLLAGGGDGKAHLYSTETGKEFKQFDGGMGSILSLAYSSDGKQILIGGVWGVKLWDVQSWIEVRKFETSNFMSSNIMSVDFTKTGNFIVAGNSKFHGGFRRIICLAHQIRKRSIKEKYISLCNINYSKRQANSNC